MIRLAILSLAIPVALLALASYVSAGPEDGPGCGRVLCQDRDEPDRPPREDDGPRRGDDRRRDDQRPRPEPPRGPMGEIERLRGEIGRLHEAAGKARERGELDKAEALMEEKKELERKLRELERQLPPRDARPGPPRRDEPPQRSPEEIEEIKREIQRLVEEAAAAKEQGDGERAEKLMQEAKGLEEMLRRGHRPPPPPERELSEKDIERVKKWLKENEPETLEKLEGLREREPGAYYHFLRETFMKMEHMEEWKKRDPEGYSRMMEIRKLDRKIWELAEKYKNAESDEAREKLRTELKQVLSKLFDFKQAQHKAEIAELEKEVAKLKEMYKTNQDQKEKIIEERLQELTGKKRSFDW